MRTPCSATVGISGASGNRTIDDTASARTLPARTIGSAPTTSANITGTWPEMMSVSAGAVPL